MSAMCAAFNIYKVYGLKIRSEILISELPIISNLEDECFDATISYGKVLEEIKDAICKNEVIQISKNEFILRVRGVANYYVANGNSIIVEPEAESNMEDVKLFLLGTSLGVMLMQRNTIAIHGGTIVVNGKGIIISGHTGVGKSTLISAFRDKGCFFLADDVSAVENTPDGEIIIHPSYPQQKLCRDAMESMSYDINKYIKVDPIRDKYAIYSDEKFLYSPVKFSAIYEINIGKSNKVEISEVSGSKKIIILLRNIYRIELCKYIGFNPQYFKYCMNIASNVRIYEITRPKSVFSVDDQIRLIENTLKVIDGG